MIDPKIVEVLICPIGGARLTLKDEKLVCTSCGAEYEITGGIPVLLAEQAKLPEGVNSVNELKCNKK